MKMPENQGKTPAFPLPSCPEPAGQGGAEASWFGIAKNSIM